MKVEILQALPFVVSAMFGTCGCIDGVVIVPVVDGAVPDGISGTDNDRALTAEECAALCGRGEPISSCRVARMCGEPECLRQPVADMRTNWVVSCNTRIACYY